MLISEMSRVRAVRREWQNSTGARIYNGAMDLSGEFLRGVRLGPFRYEADE